MYVYPMTLVVNRTGISSRRIRYYESKGLVHPSRAENDRRLFSDEDIDRLIFIKEHLEQGYTIDGIKILLNSLRN